MADLPSGQDENELEWLELFNLSSQPIDVSGYLLLDAADNVLIISSAHTSPSSTQIAPLGFLLIYRRGAKFSLNNAGDTLRLFDSTQSGQLLDTVSYSQSSSKNSWGRLPDGNSNNLVSLIPTPGVTNQSEPTPTPKPTPTSKSISNSSNTSTSPQPSSNSEPTPSPKSTTQNPSKPKSPSPQTTLLPRLATAPAILGLSSVATQSSLPQATLSRSPSSPHFSTLSLASGVCFLLASASYFLKSRQISL